MPYITQHRPAELFMEHAGVEIYHVYKDNEFDQGARTYWFAIHDDGDDDARRAPDGVFDVRCLPTPASQPRLDGHPPFVGVDHGHEAGFANYDDWKRSPEYARRRALWGLWHAFGQTAAIQNTIRHAIDIGLITVNAVLMEGADASGSPS
ncbi:MAG: hypothetical protein E5V75_34200 [Mesorhizobium sp.]|nr:MAG: hypothetical protein E5V75_34200 [Mesorhizobium sp.]